jgi:membrane-associated phospholipid phosphatase
MILLNTRSLIINFNFCLLFFIFTNLNFSFGQEESRYNPDINGFNTALDDGVGLISNPLHWKTSDWLTFSGIAGGALLISTVDSNVKDIADKNNYRFNLPMKIGKWTGEPITTFGIASGFYFYGIAADDNTAKKIGFEVVESFIYAGTIDLLLKISVGRYRPYADKGSGSFKPFSMWNYSAHSFPSGHSTVAFSLSTVLASYTDNYLLKFLIYVPALLTLTQRVYDNLHWTSDVFTGAAIGYFVGKFVVNRHNSTNNDPVNYNLGFSPNGKISFIINF